MWTDPIVEEIHQIRQKLMDQAGGDLHEVILSARRHRDPLCLVVRGPLRRPAGWKEKTTESFCQDRTQTFIPERHP